MQQHRSASAVEGQALAGWLLAVTTMGVLGKSPVGRGHDGRASGFQGKANTVGRLREQRQRWRVPGQILPAQCPFDVTPMEYKGYQIEVSRLGKGWRASIFSPNSKRPLPDSPPIWRKVKQRKLLRKPNESSTSALVANCRRSSPAPFTEATADAEVARERYPTTT